MKDAIRCCISCILPCGALDVIRIVHTNGHVEELSGTVQAAEIMKAYPKHVLKKPSSPSDGGVCPKIVIVPPEAQLQRGKIYFLMPVSYAARPQKTRSKRRRKSEEDNNLNATISVANLVVSDGYLSDILSEKQLSTPRERRRGRVAVWRPHLESISETASEVVV